MQTDWRMGILPIDGALRFASFFGDPQRRREGSRGQFAGLNFKVGRGGTAF